MKLLSLILIAIYFSSCSETGKKIKNNEIAIINDTIPETRKVVDKKPVASYWIQMGNPKLERKFGVDVYETPYTFKYVLSMQYDAMPQSDSLEVPNFGTWPKIKVIKGKEDLSCIIGFIDAKGNFREYKLLSAKDDKLRLSTLKYYSTSVRNH
jgi:hypothetical protein